MPDSVTFTCQIIEEFKPQNYYCIFNSLGKTCPMNFNPADFFISSLATRPDFEEESKAFIKEVCDTFRDSEEMRLITEEARNNMNLTKIKPPASIENTKREKVSL